ncbi:serine/threonine-protein kinase [Oceanicoccus sp. KOV_DT_Chl]|uniref:serine/threonine protein kinase n=1 Tax=Oceanicoccus sp. KOV_DT_Chl TaxID=1904639 RepID=UPI000C7E4975|nr:serine/threonine-protein kinase [Oceanicoccus sp. KOV_DT_Chl]
MSPANNKNALPAGYKLHWYQITSILGQGGFGITYLAQDLNLDREVAIKEYLPTEFAHRDSNFLVSASSEENQSIFAWGLERFMSEGRTLSKFEHPNIVKVHAVFEEHGTGYMVMPYEYGESLQDILNRQTSFDEETLLSMTSQLMDGLQLVHNHHFIHRDIKPDNIYIRNDGSPVLLDFGSARQSLSGESKALTVLVTPGYAPMEQYYSDGDEQGPWTDIYGLGATLYRAVTGQALTNAVDRSKLILDNKSESHTTALSSSKGQYSSQFLRAIDRAIEFKPADRPQTIAEWASYFPTTGSELSSTQILPANKIKASSSTTSNSYSVKPVFLIPALLLLVGVAGYFYLNPGQEFPVSKQAAKEAIPAAEPIAAQQNSSHINEPPTGLDIAQPKEAEQERSDQLQQELQAQRAKEQEQQRKIAEENKRLQQQVREQQRQAEIQQQQAEQRRLQNIERAIDASRMDFKARSAAKQDAMGFQEAEESQILAQLPDKQVRISVAANIDRWQSSGIKIIRGEHYLINSSGRWQMGGLCKETDANGEGGYSLLCLDIGGQTVANYPHSALIGKIGKTSLPFFIGNGFEFTADKDGILYFMSNDAPGYFNDNRSNLSVSISLN